MSSEIRPPVKVVVVAGAALAARMRAELAAAEISVVAACADAAEAVDAVERLRPHVCVVDRGLPRRCTRPGRSDRIPPAAARVLVVGGHGLAAEHRAALLVGASGSLPASAGGAELASAVAALAVGKSPGYQPDTSAVAPRPREVE